MGIVNVLDKSISEKIAAGEVVERPASVIKELVENSVDAGATAVTVEIKNGGSTYMRVTDNGCGMCAEDARTALLRHATSKIKNDTDLEHISTLGFRGEALCSIAAVSKMQIITKERGAMCGTCVTAEGGKLLGAEEVGCPDGTTVVVKNLFYNTPARMKFMKKDSAEAAYIADCLNKQALSRCDVSIRFIRDGKEILHTPGDNTRKSAVHAVYGRDIAAAMLPVEYEKDGVRVRGMCGAGNLSRPNRLMQSFFVNSRFVISKILSAALAEAYKNELMVGRFPVCVLDVGIDYSLVDVNVHPGKTEVKFAEEKTVYDAVYWAVKSALAKNAELVKRPAEVQSVRLGGAAIFKSTPEKTVTFAKNAGNIGFKPYAFKKEEKEKKPQTCYEVREELTGFEDVLPIKKVEALSTPAEEKKTACTEASREAAPPVRETPAPERVEYDIIGQLFSTYILAQNGDSFFLMDQHAAHERIKYEEIKQNGNRVQTQSLLMPIDVNLTAAEKALLEENASFICEMGFETEDFGKGSVILRTLPADCRYEDGADLLIELLTILAGNEKGSLSHIRDKAVYTVACKSAIKANKLLSPEEQKSLFERAAALEGITTCPHGRPILVKLTKYKIEKMFGRIV